MPADAAGEHDFLEVTAFLQQIVERVAVRDADHILLDDGTVVEHFGDVVAGGSDELHAPRVGGVIGPRADERGQWPSSLDPATDRASGAVTWALHAAPRNPEAIARS